MGGIFFQFGTAAHLALLTVAPLFLYSVCGQSAQAAVLAWLSVLAAIWIVMNPSPRGSEWPRDARRRIGREIARDPLLALCAVAVAVAAVRAVNGGVGFDYDAVAGVWKLKGPFLSRLPGSVSGAGMLPLAGLVGLSAVTLGVRHALGPRARSGYLLVSGLLAALAALLWRVLSANGVAVPGLVASSSDPYPLGSLLGVHFLFALAAWAESRPEAAALPELAAAGSAGVLLGGMLAYAPAYAVWAFALSGLAIFAFGPIVRRTRVWWRTALAVALLCAPVSYLFLSEGLRTVPVPPFPEGFAAVRDAATAVAVRAWKGAALLGAGLGSYPLAQGMFATADDWRVLTDLQTGVPNGWVQILLERGLLGIAIPLTGVGLLLGDAVLRLVRGNPVRTSAVQRLLGTLALTSVAILLFVESSYARPEALMPIGAALALTAASSPESSEAEHG